MNPHKSSVPDFFLNLGVVVTLYVVVVSFLSLAFDIVNKLFPDNLAYYDYYSSGVRMAIATLIIVFPLFVWLSSIVTKALTADPSRRELGVRRWLVYITLFLSSATIVTDLVVLLNTFLNGEITTRFILKVVAVLVVGGIVFWHYLSEARGTSSVKKYQVAVYGSSVLVVALVVYAFAVFGSPATIRKQRADETRVSNLQSIQYEVLNRWQQKGAVPEKLTELVDSLSGFTIPVDPETAKDYVYTKTGKFSFKLCADFNLETSAATSQYTTFGLKGTEWNHAAGTSCFDRTIDPELYPVNPTGLKGL